MPFIKREDLDKKVRAPHEKSYKAKLKKALTDPLITPEDREHIKEQLATLGKPKVYRRDSPIKPGAVDLS